MSLDVQDLNSCLNTIQAIERIVDKQFKGVNYYRQLKSLESNKENSVLVANGQSGNPMEEPEGKFMRIHGTFRPEGFVLETAFA